MHRAVCAFTRTAVSVGARNVQQGAARTVRFGTAGGIAAGAGFLFLFEVERRTAAHCEGGGGGIMSYFTSTPAETVPELTPAQEAEAAMVAHVARAEEM